MIRRTEHTPSTLHSSYTYHTPYIHPCCGTTTTETASVKDNRTGTIRTTIVDIGNQISGLLESITIFTPPLPPSRVRAASQVFYTTVHHHHHLHQHQQQIPQEVFHASSCIRSDQARALVEVFTFGNGTRTTTSRTGGLQVRPYPFWQPPSVPSQVCSHWQR